MTDVMQQAGVSQKAMLAVGNNPAGNFVLEPERHAERLGPEAGPLRRIIESPAVQATIQRFQDSERLAGASRKRYRRTSSIILIFLGFAIAAGVAAWTIVPTMGKETEGMLRPWATLIVYLSLIVPLVLAWRLGKVRHFEIWNESRGATEYLRRQLFEQVMDAGEKSAPGELPLLPLKFEYFRRYQLDLQHEYHAIRAQENGARARRAVLLLKLSIAIVVAWLVSAIIGMLSATADQGAMSEFLRDPANVATSALQRFDMMNFDSEALVLGVILALLCGASFLRSSLDNNLRNASRFAAARQNLEYLRDSGLDEARRASERGDEAGVRRFIGRVLSVTSAELVDWVRLQELDAGKSDKAGAN